MLDRFAQEVLNGLYIGDERSAMYPDVSKYTGVINVSHEVPFSSMLGEDVKRKRFDVSDIGSDNEQLIMLNIFSEAIVLMDDWLQHPPVLIHCAEGKQRSVAVVTAYIMYLLQIPVEGAKKAVQTAYRRAFDHGTYCHFDNALTFWDETLRTCLHRSPVSVY